MIDNIITILTFFAGSSAFMTVIGLIVSIFKFAASKKAIKKIASDAKETFDNILNSSTLQGVESKLSIVAQENVELKKALRECTEALTRIREHHPEIFKGEKK